jgi:hypothetical protein
MSAIDLILERLAGYHVQPNGHDRWRACCPAHDGNNRTALSIGVGAEGQVLLKCWHSCGIDAIAQALDLEVTDLFPPRESGAGKPLRRRLLSATQALELIESEMTIGVLCAADMAAGKPLDSETRERLLQAAARIATLRTEVLS